MSNPLEPVLSEDEVFVSRCRDGEVAAFGVLVERYQKRMFNLAFRMTGDPDTAAEVVQEAFLSAFGAIRRFRGDAAFATWLTGIVLNHAQNRIKQTRNRSRHEPVSLDDPPAPEQGAARFDPPAQGLSALERLEQQALQEAVQEAINALDPDAREVLVLRDLQDFSYEEIGTILKLNAGTVKSRISRAREALKARLKKRLGDW